MVKLFALFLVAWLIWPVALPAQTKVADSLRTVLRRHPQADTIRVRILYQLSQQLNPAASPEADSLCREALQLAQALGDITGEVKSLSGMAEIAARKKAYGQAASIYRKALQLAETHKNRHLQVMVLRGLVNVLQGQDRYDEALRQLKRQQKVVHTLGNKRLLIENLTETADTYVAKGNYAKALTHALKASAIAEQVRDTLLIIQTRSNLGLLYTVMKDYPRALDYQQKALSLARQNKIPHAIGIALSRTGETLLAQNKPQLAISYFRQALAVSKSLGYPVMQATCEGDLADALERIGSYQEALEQANRAYAYLKTTGSQSMNAWIQAILARTYLHTNRPDSAISLGQQSFQAAREVGHKEYSRDASLLLAEAYKKQNNYAEAYRYQSIHIVYRDSLLNEENTRQIAWLTNRADLLRKQDQITLLEKDKQLQAAESKRKSLILWSLLAVMLLTLALVVQLIRNNQHKQQQADQLLALDELRTRFFSNITHEFRTPLSLIILPTEQLLRDTTLSEPIRRGLAAIDRNARQLLRLINQLLDLSKLEAGSMSVAGLAGNPLEFIRQMVELFRPAAEGKGIRLSFISDTAATEYLFDADKWEKIVYNLLSNALKFTPEGGQVQVIARLVDPQQLQVQVIDTGVGIPADKLPYIFDRFYQADNTRTRSYEGSGIGLALVKELTQLLHGQISVTSEPAQGTRVELSLPVQPTEGGEQAVPLLQPMSVQPLLAYSPAEATPAAPLVVGKPLILVVEDNAELREFIAQGLSDLYQVLTAANGSEGWQRARLDLPDIILSDVMMPDMDGYALCQLVKETAETSHIAVVLLTARTSYESRIEGLSYGADDYLAKPFHFSELLLRVRNLLDRQQKLRTYYARRLTDPTVEDLSELEEDPFLTKLYAIIDKNLENSDFGVEELATEAGISRRTLNRKLTAVAAISASDFIRQYRLKRAIEFLRSGCGVAETGYRVGFENPSYFTSVFKEVYKVTPSEYMAR